MSRNTMLLSVIWITTFCILASAQVIPQSAHVNLYFPQLADGGPPESQWQTTFIFSNANLKSVSVVLVFNNDNGDSLALDFGEDRRILCGSIFLLPVRACSSPASAPR